MDHRMFYGFSFGVFALCFMFLAASLIFTFSGGGEASHFYLMLAFLWFALALLANWLGLTVKKLSDRLDRIEQSKVERD